MLLHVTAEIGRRRETEQVGDADEGQRLVAEQAGDVEHGVAVYPIVGGITAYLAGNFGQVFGRDAQLVGIPVHFAVFAVRPVLQHVEEAAHDGGALQRDIVYPIQMGMEIEEVDDQHLYGGYQQVAAEMVVGLCQPCFHHLEVPTAQFPLSGIQFHDD